MSDEPDNDLDLPAEAIEGRNEPKSSKQWLAMLQIAEKDQRDYNDRCDNVEKHYANADRLASLGRDREFAMFWANVQVLAPSIYARPPVPVVVPRFKDRSEVKRKASELLERSVTVGFELQDIDGVMRLVRDDLVITGRGVTWVRYEKRDKDGPERVCIEWVHRKDFLHETARCWPEVGWVAKRSWMTRGEMRKRFFKNSGKAYRTASFNVRKDENDGTDQKLKAPVWEVWHKGRDLVVWVTEGVDVVLDESEPHLTLEGFFPCPRPAYGTVQRGSLVPVPDMLFYKDQLEEINALTARIAALTDAVKIRGFYPAGAGEVADAIERAMKSLDDNALLVPIANMATLGTGAFKDQLIWLPIDQIVSAIRDLTELRRQLIDDVYQITGLSDIMRGSTNANETLGAQQLKSNYGSVRIRDKQEELVRVARDLTRLDAEIMAENFASKTMLDMAQMDLPTKANIDKQVKAIIAEATRIASDPAAMAQFQQNPQALEQAKAQAEGRIADLENEATVEAVMELLRDQRLRPFVLDIETDSTIAPDENAQKQRVTEYVTAVGSFLSQAVPLVKTDPVIAPFVGETLKLVQNTFRIGRSSDQTVDELVDKLKELSKQPPADPNAGKPDPKAQAEADIASKQADSQLKMQETQAKIAAEMQAHEHEIGLKAQAAELDSQNKQAEMAARTAEIQATARLEADRHGREMAARDVDLQLKQLDLQIKQITGAASIQSAAMKNEGEAAARAAQSTENA